MYLISIKRIYGCMFCQRCFGKQTARHSLTTRLLYSCISAKLYSGDATLDALLADLAQQLSRLSEDGFEAGFGDLSLCPICIYVHIHAYIYIYIYIHIFYIHYIRYAYMYLCMCHDPRTPTLSFSSSPACQIDGHRIRLICIGVKGDWAFIRKAPWS